MLNRFSLCCALAVMLVFIGGSSQAQEDSPPPYLYYYSDVLNGIVVERADGTDSRLLAQGLLQPQDGSLFLTSGEWSPSGDWLTLRVLDKQDYRTYTGKGYAVRMDGYVMAMLDTFQCIYGLVWHPTEDWLFVMGQLYGECREHIRGIGTYWLIDASTETLLVSASIEETQDYGPALYWYDDKVVFSAQEWEMDRYYTVTMFYDGQVEIETYSFDEWREGLTYPEGGLEDRRAMGVLDYPPTIHFVMTEGFQLRDEPEAYLSFDPPLNSSSSSPVRSVLWDDERQWALFGYEFCFAGCSDISHRVSVYHPTSKLYREISACGIDVACVGWLPDAANRDLLPAGQEKSVLAAPLYYTAPGNDRFRPPTHELICIPPYLSYEVRNLATGNVDYVMPLAEPCALVDDRSDKSSYEYYQPYTPNIVFALSPDGRYFSANFKLVQDYVTLHNAITGEKLVTLNIIAERIAFSHDSALLYTSGRNSSAAWRIEDVLKQSN